MNKQRLFVFDAAPVYRGTLDIAMHTILDSRKFTTNPGLLTPVVRIMLNCVFLRQAVIAAGMGTSGDDLTTRNIRQNMKHNPLDIDIRDHLLFTESFSTSSLLKRRTEKLLPFRPTDFRFQLYHLDKSIWAIITGTDL